VTKKFEANIRPVTHMKTRAAELLKTVDETRRPIVITQNGKPRGVLLDFESYQEIRQATLLLKLLVQGEAEARSGKTVSQDEVFTEARRRIRRK
jgi:prevent-host-death family protein